MRYSLVDERKEVGAHYTPKLLADFVADGIVSAMPSSYRRKCIRVLDPAVGDGELLCSILEVFENSNFSDFNIYGFDTNSDAIELANGRITSSFPNILLRLRNENFLDFAAKKQGQLSLFEKNDNDLEYFDVVIANPPYVRTQVMGAGKAQKLAKQFNLSGRVDLYHAFIQGIAQVLYPGGIAGIIVSNRFLSA